ncbi:hypothetical protein SAMN04487818_110104 [Actinokineospora terrae]|uniref:Uncharacterized protein n=1 Tax=Actinokineospora terrae TaxID=155974 RepID=A0A1H9WDV4_9PSEU|nr:hypothetical protein SAMN04487818_110104 [Actinokineospora terrae]
MGPAKFGHSGSADYRKTFFTAHPHLKGTVVVHHAVERQAERRYPTAGLTPEEINSLENLRGISKGDVNNRMHLSALRIAWNRFYAKNVSASKQDLLNFATELDDKHGASFRPRVR